MQALMKELQENQEKSRKETGTTHFFIRKIFYKKMSLKNPKNLKKMSRKSPGSNV